MFRFLQNNWDMLALGVIGAAGAVLGVIHDDKRKNKREDAIDKAKYIYESHVNKED